jgi:hypothetical protein
MTDFRALCAELLLFAEQAGEIAANESLWPKCDPDYSMLDRTAAALEAQPEPQGPTDEELDDQFFEHCYTDDFGNELMERQQFRKGVRAALARWGRPAIEPVPVSKRLPGPDDCDAEGRCWWLKQAANPEHDLLTPTWHLQRHGPAGSTFFKYTHWLPCWALPVP